MKNIAIVVTLILVSLTCGCVMFRSWQSIPPPGGCDQCHTVAIGNDWQVSYQAPYLTDERNREYFQSAAATMAPRGKPSSSLDLRKDAELACFECHRAPNIQHQERKGRYHH